MVLMNKLFNLFAMPLALCTLALLLPPYFVYKLITSLVNSFHHEDLSHKVVVITGASSGIGEELAYQYAKKRACLVLVARRENRLREVAQRAQALGSPDVLVIPADVAKSEDCKHVIDETVDHFGRLDHLVNNAGIFTATLFEEITDVQKISSVMDINFWGSVYPTYYSIPHLKKSRGTIVVSASVAGYVGSPRNCVYGATKGALVQFYDSLRVELGAAVQITIVNPGWIESEITKGKLLSKEGETIIDEETRDVLVGIFPIETAEECAKAILKGAGRGDRYVTVPAWYRPFFLFKTFCPEVLEWLFRTLYVTSHESSTSSSFSKKLLDLTGAKRLLYPSSLISGAQVEECKTE